MKAILQLVVIIGLISAARAQGGNCSLAISCFGCASSSSCNWCPSSGRCLTSTETCIGTRVATTGDCCSQGNNCADCLDESRNYCVWCDSENLCKDGDSSGAREGCASTFSYTTCRANGPPFNWYWIPGVVVLLLVCGLGPLIRCWNQKHRTVAPPPPPPPPPATFLVTTPVSPTYTTTISETTTTTTSPVVPAGPDPYYPYPMQGYPSQQSSPPLGYPPQHGTLPFGYSTGTPPLGYQPQQQGYPPQGSPHQGHPPLQRYSGV